MVALCQQKAAREGLAPTLFVQAMHELDPPRSYRTIFVCGAFGLGSTRQQDQEALNRFYRCLEPAGTLVLDIEVPYADAKRWGQWLKSERRRLPEPWPPPGARDRASDGAEYELRARAVQLDPLSQRMTLQIRAEMWRDGQVVVAEERAVSIHLYFRDELLLMLAEAGFGDVMVRGNHTEEEATSDHDFLVFVARKRDERRVNTAGRGA
jgi:hypothetical protein